MVALLLRRTAAIKKGGRGRQGPGIYVWSKETTKRRRKEPTNANRHDPVQYILLCKCNVDMPGVLGHKRRMNDKMTAEQAQQSTPLSMYPRACVCVCACVRAHMWVRAVVVVMVW